ncbi:MAG: hypothetical protein RI967_1574 [Planctomycetota bacterium]|jgi:hypothetical protein
MSPRRPIAVRARGVSAGLAAGSLALLTAWPVVASAADSAAESSADSVAVDPALAGRELGPWTMVPAALSVPVAIVVGAVLVWYFVRLGRPEVPRARRLVRRMSIVCALAGLPALVRGLTFVHPHEDRAGWALAWSVTLLALVAWATLAVVDVILTLREGWREYRALRRETLGGRARADG